MAIDVEIGVLLAIIGIVLLALELVHPGALLFIPGSILLVAGFFYLFFPTYLDTAVGPILIVVVAAIATVIELFYYRWVAPVHHPLSTTVDSLVGEDAVVTVEVVPDTLRGKVRVKSEVWSARSSVRIPVGAHVRVVSGEGVSVSVEPVEPAPAS